jgi:hypothetical protein
MRAMRTLLASVLFVAVAACGGKAKPASVDPGTTEQHAEHGEHGDHPELTPEMHAFHEVLAPVWHHDGPDRRDSACAAVPELKGAASPLAELTPAGVEPATWEASATDLVMTLEGLEAQCQDGADIEPVFSQVHDGFHHLMELLPR